MKPWLRGVILLLALVFASAWIASPLRRSRKATDSEPSTQLPAAERWTLAWSDEFDGANASRPDHSKWKFEVGGNGWGNHELEYYTDRPENSRVDQGKLIIEARREDYTGEDGVTRRYTSARLVTRGTFSQAYGRFTARIKLPRGQGVWPAFWLLGDDFEKVSWPACGEIDIMENIGKSRRPSTAPCTAPATPASWILRLPTSYPVGLSSLTISTYSRSSGSRMWCASIRTSISTRLLFLHSCPLERNGFSIIRFTSS